MPDKFSKQTRSRIMSSIRSKNTKPELQVRKLVWALGKRFRIHDRTVFGTPDISNKSKRVAVFIDGCFWHGCPRCYSEPKSNTEFWRNKIARNRDRRKKVKSELRKEGWTVMEFWEHAVRKEPIPIAISISEKI
ncbi:very short patch repair endonuclease [Nitrosopumilus piranensis]|uniref:HpaII very short patch repair endonuclease n=1 Tax=Nitrosopumilus piranensis TaxID=1582439 RepID=A0A0C5BXM7_9ARCH|nr:very short patch repair endonuclease [Nitrosopumilus piranensis]AJM93041.1 HpaII very short patch repair endonuclease [Nitrosopumilus piranensis]